MIKYFFRKPVFPVICDIQGTIIGARTPAQFDEEIQSISLPAGKQFPVVDASGEGWTFVVDYLTVTPLACKKRWTKKEIISLFNNNACAKQANIKYSMKSISAKRFDRIITELVANIKTLTN